MTRRAVLIGFIGFMFICGFGYINDQVFRFQAFASGHLLPVIVIGLLFLTVLVVNPLLFQVRKSWMLRPAEMTLIVVLMMVACSIPGQGLMSTFTHIMVMPFHWDRVNPGWREHNLLDYAPKRALVDATDHEEVVNGFIMGAPESSEPTSLGTRIGKAVGRVPWASWKAPLLTWLPMVFLLAIASASLMLVVHRQWSAHECLSYPIADFTESLLQREEGQRLPSILGNRLFWIGFGIIFAIRLNNGIHAWYPEYMIPIKLTYSFQPFGEIWPSIRKVQFGSYSLLVLRIIPIAIAFAFFLSSEIALTLGLSQILWVIFAIPLVTMGVSLSTQYGKGGWSGWQRAGSYVALTLMLLYTGRQYYKETFLSAVTVWRRKASEATEVWACRVFIVSTLVLIGLVMALGLELPFAVGTILLMLMTFMVVSRISAETGLFWIHPRWQPYGALLGLFGCCAMKPEAIVISAMVCTILCINQGEVFMPYLCNGLKLCEKNDLSLPKVTGVTLGMYGAGVLLALVVILGTIYTGGTPVEDNWSYKRIPTMPYRNVKPEVMRLKATGMFETVETLPWYSRLRYTHPEKNFLWAAGFGFVAVIVFSVLRLRLTWWPLHPALFLLWASWPMVMMSHSILLGWLIKKAVVRFGGNSAVQRIKPLMVGIIAGEVAGAFFCMLAGVIYYAITGEQQISYRFIP